MLLTVICEGIGPIDLMLTSVLLLWVLGFSGLDLGVYPRPGSWATLKLLNLGPLELSASESYERIVSRCGRVLLVRLTTYSKLLPGVQRRQGGYKLFSIPKQL